MHQPGRRSAIGDPLACLISAVAVDLGGQPSMLLAAAARPGPEEPALPGLPARAREVLGLVAQGLDDAAIAGRLGLSRTTVRNHVNGLYRRLRVGPGPGLWSERMSVAWGPAREGGASVG